jgi:anion-transporting  ArsA/GET3 family ATPase
MTPVIELAAERRIVICCGSGGVGKTTTAAAIALEGARQGRRAVVVTIDPAKRLADALGLSGGLTDVPTEIDGPWSGSLSALMLDTKSTFDALVSRYSVDDEQAQRILANRFYRNISGRLSGTQEYMAAEKLYELHDDKNFDLVVVDTPPTRNALDFLDAPGRLVRFLDHRLYRVLMTPTRAYLRAVGVAAQAFLRTVSKVVGGEVLGDAIAFFQAFDGMEAGFRERAERVLHLLEAPETAYVLVTSPRRESVEEADFFARRLAEGNLVVAALIVNRMHPSFGQGAGDGDGRAARDAAVSQAGTPLGALWANLADFREVAASEEAQFGSLATRVAPAPVVHVPVLRSDVHDLAGLAEVAGYIFGEGRPAPG